MRRALAVPIVLAALTAACGAILGLEEPTPPQALSLPDASADLDAGAGAGDAGGPVACAALDASIEGSIATYFDLAGLVTDDSGVPTWSFFDTTRAMGRGEAFAGGTFDGRYVYFAPRQTVVLRFDTQEADGDGFDQVGAWSTFDVAELGLDGGFFGAAFDGRYVYFVPSAVSGAPASVLARYDTRGAFTSSTAWASFDLATLAGDAGAATSGFLGSVFDGRYLYFVPHNDGVPDGRVVRYDTLASRDAAVPESAGESGSPADAGDIADSGEVDDAGDGGDAGYGNDAGDSGAGGASIEAGALGDPAQWSTFDISSLTPTAVGFYGGVFDGTFVHFVPYANDAFGSVVHGGASGLAARFRSDAGFVATASWATFDLTSVNGDADGYVGGAFDGQYIYFAPHGNGIAIRLNVAAPYASVGSWATYDVTRIGGTDAGTADYIGAGYDGRFVYYVPSVAGLARVLRYDTLSPFSEDCAWSVYDVGQIAPPDASPTGYSGAIFDGQYLYLVPAGHEAVRFRAKTPAAMPHLPAFSGSFL
jgi:hypothetical protein